MMVLEILRSLKTTVVLTLLVIVLMFYGGFAMPSDQAYSSMNQIPLFQWLTEHPLTLTWWLWGTILVLALLILNTIVCTVDSIIKITSRTSLMLRISAQIIHVSFCFIVLAHLLSSIGSYKSYAIVPKNSTLVVDEDTRLYFSGFDYRIYGGYISDIRAIVEIQRGSTSVSRYLAPNKPVFVSGIGLYMKDFALFPEQKLLVELSREPGAIWALIGAVLFSAGTVSLVLLKLKDRRI